MKIVYTLVLGIGLVAALTACGSSDAPAPGAGGGTPPAAGAQDPFTGAVAQAASVAPEDQEPSDVLAQTVPTTPENTEPVQI